MFIAKRRLPRRTVLRGMGATIALPLLESMVPAATPLRAAAPTPTRFTGIFIPHGAAPGYWIPDAVGRHFTYPYIWEPLEPFRDQVVLTSGLWSRSAESPPGVTGADHFVAAAYLCAEKPKKTTGADIRAGTTIDQLIAQRTGQDTLLPSLQLAVEDPGANLEQLRRGLQLRLHELHLVADADPASADGDQPAGGVRADVRRREHGRGAAPPPGRSSAASSTRSPGASPACGSTWGPGTASGSTSTCRTCARSSGGSRWRPGRRSRRRT